MKRSTPENTVAIDTETSLILPGVTAPPLVCVSISSQAGEGLAMHNDPDLFEDLVHYFSKYHVTGANFVYDIGVFMRHDKRLIKPMFDALHDDRVHCVQMREKLHDLAAGKFMFHEDEEGEYHRISYSLDAISRRRKGGGKHWASSKYRLSYHDYYHDPDTMPQDARDYAIVDSKITRDIHLEQGDHGNEPAQVRAHMALHLASARGIMTDNHNVMLLHDQCTEWLEKVRCSLETAGLIRGDGSRNTKKAVRTMIDAMGENVLLTTKGEERLVDHHKGDMQKFLKEAYSKGKWVSVSTPSCIESGNDQLLHYGVHSKLSSLLTGTVKHLEAGTWLPIQTYFDPLKETGRTGSSGPNIQNQRRSVDIPHPFDRDEHGRPTTLSFKPDPRACFKARDGYALLACDYHQAETHTLAQVTKTLFGFSKMADALNSEQSDLHVWVASLLMGRSYEDVANLMAEAERCKRFKLEPSALVREAVKKRQLAKVANFGLPGGCGPTRLSAFAKGYGVHDLDVYTAAQLKQTWLAAWPELAYYFDYISQCENEDGWYTVDHIGVARVRGRASFTAACNSFFQGLAADGAKAALWEVTRRQWCDPTSALAGTYVVNFVHDEIILEVPVRQLEATARELMLVMEEEFNRFTPDVPVTTSAEAGFHWSKSMRSVFDENGEYIWEEAA